MSQRVEIELVDDVDGSAASETIRFGIDGTSYEIDLNSENAKALRNAFDGYIGAARRASGASSSTARGRRGGNSSGRGRTQLEDVRAWARENGHKVSDRGRVPFQVLEAYDSAH